MVESLRACVTFSRQGHAILLCLGSLTREKVLVSSSSLLEFGEVLTHQALRVRKIPLEPAFSASAAFMAQSPFSHSE